MKIAILPGDGIGTEIMAEAVKVLNALDLSFETEEALVGGAAYEAHGHPLPESTLNLAKAADAVLFGAVGDWKYDKLDRPLRPEQAILGLRKHLGLFANFRPAICYEQLTHASSLKPELVSGLDILIIRELTGDIYFGQPRGRRSSPDGAFQGAEKNGRLGDRDRLRFVADPHPKLHEPSGWYFTARRVPNVPRLRAIGRRPCPAGGRIGARNRVRAATVPTAKPR